MVAVWLSVRIQPAASARILRRGADLEVIAGRIGIAAPGGAQCIAPTVDGALRFDQTFAAEDAGGETIGIAVRFDYVVPQQVPHSWPAGDWCASLRARVDGQM